jgi:hypothetical protein
MRHTGCELERRNSRDKMWVRLVDGLWASKTSRLSVKGSNVPIGILFGAESNGLLNGARDGPAYKEPLFSPQDEAFCIQERVTFGWCSLSAKRASFMIFVSVSSALKALKGGNWRGVRVEPWKGRETLWGKAAQVGGCLGRPYKIIFSDGCDAFFSLALFCHEI